MRICSLGCSTREPLNPSERWQGEDVNIVKSSDVINSLSAIKIAIIYQKQSKISETLTNSHVVG